MRTRPDVLVLIYTHVHEQQMFNKAFNKQLVLKTKEMLTQSANMLPTHFKTKLTYSILTQHLIHQNFAEMLNSLNQDFNEN